MSPGRFIDEERVWTGGLESPGEPEGENYPDCPESPSDRNAWILAKFYDRKSYNEALRETYRILEEITDFWSFLPWKPVTVLVPENIKIDPTWIQSHMVAPMKHTTEAVFDLSSALPSR